MRPIYALLIIILFCQMLFAEESKPVILFPDHHLCLEATGKVVMKADKAIFSFETKGYGPTLREAVTNAKSKVTEITKELNALGIGNDSFATGSFTSGQNLNASFLTDKKDYLARLTTTISLRDLSKLDEAILILTDKKAENLSSISYSLDDQSRARQQAREMSLNRIAEQRDTISRILGVEITDVILIDEAPFDKLPWETEQTYNYNYNNNLSNTLKVRGGRSNEINFTVEGLDSVSDTNANTGGLYTPDVTVENQIRVLYKIGLKPTK